LPPMLDARSRFRGHPHGAPVVSSSTVGLVNGVLFTSTLWYYLDKYHYPYLERLGLLYPDLLTPRAELLLKYLPPRLFEGRPEVLGGFAILLVILSVRR